MTTPLPLTCDYPSLVNEVGLHLFGLRPTSVDVISDHVASANQAADILRALAKGLQYVYSAYRWSFLRPLVSITTHAAYSTGLVTVDASGNVTGVGTVFPSYAASAGGWISIRGEGSFAVASYVSGTSLTLANYTGSAVTTPTPYALGFNRYPLPAGVDSLEGRLTYPPGSLGHREYLEKMAEVELRQAWGRNVTPGRPQAYAETMGTFDPTQGSARYVTFFPIPDGVYTLTAVGTMQPTMIDAGNPYPFGDAVLAPCIVESCLAAAERDVQQMDAAHPEAVHNRALGPLLAMAIERDKEYSSPDTLGVDRGEDGRRQCQHARMERILWNGGGFSGYI